MTNTDADTLPEGRAFIELLHKIEKKVNPVKCKHIHFNYWPIIRFLINVNRKRADVAAVDPYPAISNERRYLLYRDALRKCDTGAAALNDLQELAKTRIPGDYFEKLPQADALFLTRKAQYRHIIEGLTFEPLTDGLRYLSEQASNALTIVDKNPCDDGEAFLLETSILPARSGKRAGRFIVSFAKPNCLAELRARDRIVKTISRVNAAIPDKLATLRVDEAEVLYRIELSTERLMYWTALLDHVRPKAIYLSSYTGVHYICAAAKRHEIPVIDIQHGGMHSHHPLVANWIRKPKQGYELLPDFFWCWDKRSADYINSDPDNPHPAIIGGNPKTALEYALRKTGTPAQPPATTSRPQVLVALQYGADRMVESHLKQAYLATREMVDWRFRMHPMGWNFLDQVVAEFDVTRTSVEDESSKPLHQVLSEVDLVLCNASTIIHEALDYGAAGAVWSDKGAAIFDDLVRAKQITVATEFESLMRLLSELKTPAVSGHTRPTPDQLQRDNIALVRKTFASLMSA